MGFQKWKDIKAKMPLQRRVKAWFLIRWDLLLMWARETDPANRDILFGVLTFAVLMSVGMSLVFGMIYLIEHLTTFIRAL